MADLDSLIIDDNDLARDELAVGLQPFVRLTRAGRLILEPDFNRLPSERQVLCVLLALQAAHMLGLRETAAAVPAEVIELSGMPPGTVRPKLSALLKARHVVKDGSAYCVPVHSIRRAAALLGDAG
jgi:hypothetical protein